MEFGSIDEVVAYVKSAIADSMNEVADEMVNIAKEETDSQLMGYSGSTGQTVGNIEPTSVSSTMAEITWRDGDWFSVFTGEHVYAPLMRELGYTWGVSASNFVESSYNQIENEIPRLFVSLLRARGIPIE